MHQMHIGEILKNWSHLFANATRTSINQLLNLKFTESYIRASTSHSDHMPQIKYHLEGNPQNPIHLPYHYFSANHIFSLTWFQRSQNKPTAWHGNTIIAIQRKVRLKIFSKNADPISWWSSVKSVVICCFYNN